MIENNKVLARCQNIHQDVSLRPDSDNVVLLELRSTIFSLLLSWTSVTMQWRMIPLDEDGGCQLSTKVLLSVEFATTCSTTLDSERVKIKNNIGEQVLSMKCIQVNINVCHAKRNITLCSCTVATIIIPRINPVQLQQSLSRIRQINNL